MIDWGWIVAAAMFLVAGGMLVLARWNAAQAQHLETQRDDARSQRDRLNTRNSELSKELGELRVLCRQFEQGSAAWERKFTALSHVYEEAVRKLDEARKELDARPVADPHKTVELPTPQEQQYVVKPKRSNGRRKVGEPPA